MPAPMPAEDNPNSLWRPGARAFFKDIRAKEVGDTVTVRLKLDDSAKMSNKTKRKRDDNEKMGLQALMGYEAQLGKILPRGCNSADLFDFGTKSNTDGDGDIGRSETIEITFAALVIQVLPNGALAIMGRQEVRVNYERRDRMLTWR